MTDNLESVITEAWRTALEVPDLAPEDDFFKLGGDSFTAMRLLARIEEATGIPVTFGDLLQAPVLREFVGLARAAGSRSSKARSRRRRSWAPATTVQSDRWRRRKRVTTGAEVFWLYEIEGDLDVVALQRAFDELVKRHEILRTTFARKRGRVRQIVHRPPTGVLQVVDLAADTPKRLRTPMAVAQGLFEEDYGAFDYRRGPLLRAKLVTLAPRRYILSVAANEMVMDAGSRRVFGTAVSTLYALLVQAGSADDYPFPPAQFSDIAVALHRRVGRRGFVRQLDYWNTKVAGMELELPLRGHPMATPGATPTRTLELSPKLVTSVREAAQAFAVSSFNVLCAAFTVVLRAITESSEPAFTTTFSPRDLRGADESLGPFFNIVLLAVPLDEVATASDLIRATAAVTTEAFLHGYVSLPRVLSMRKRPPVSGWSLDVARVRFQLHEEPGDIELVGVHMRPVPPPFSVSHELYLEVTATAKGFSLFFSCRPDLPRRTVDNFLPTYRQVLDTLTRRPDVKVASLVAESVRALVR